MFSQHPINFGMLFLVFIHLKVFSNFTYFFFIHWLLKIVLFNFHRCVNFPVFLLLLISCLIPLRLKKMLTHFLKYFPHSAGISVGLRWNHHHLPLPSYWILCPEVWKGNLSLSSFVVTVPLLTMCAGNQNHCLCYLHLTLLTFHIKLHPMAYTRQTTWSGRADDKGGD